MAYSLSEHHSKTAIPAGSVHVKDPAPVVPDNVAEGADVINFTWREKPLRGCCHAGSAIEDVEAIGGFGKSKNLPRKVRAAASGNGLFLLAQPNSFTTLFDNHPGMRLALVNLTQDLLAFEAQDGGLMILQEAIDSEGEWHTIEYWMASDCGNSYHRVFLPPQQFWSFSVRRYRGEFPTKLRFTMTLADGTKFSSNEFEGSINPSQFELPNDPYVFPKNPTP